MTLSGLTYLFWGSVTVIFYSYAGFLILIWIASLMLNRRVEKAPVTPKVSLIIAAYNEAQSIAAKIENSLKMNYSRECFEIIVTSDGSTDSTAAIAASYANDGVVVLDLPRRGKIFALQEAV